MLLGGAIATARLVATGAWLPRDTKGVLSFALAEMLLVPLGLVLLLCGWLQGVQDRRRRTGGGPPARWVGPVLALLGAVLVLLSDIVVFPVLSRKLSWGRYGIPIEEPLRDLRDMTRLSGIPVAPGSRLVKGAITWSGPSTHVYAVITLTRGQFARLLRGEDGWRWWTVADPKGSFLPIPPEMERDLAGRSGILYATGGGTQRVNEPPSVTIMAAYFAERDRAVVCLYWLPVW